MERNEACPKILLASLHLFYVLFPAVHLSFCLSFILPLSTPVAMALSRWLCLMFDRFMAGSVVSHALCIFFHLARFQKALYLLSLGSTTLCINPFNYAFIYAAIALCKCTLWLNKLFHCLAVWFPRWSVCRWHHEAVGRGSVSKVWVLFETAEGLGRSQKHTEGFTKWYLVQHKGQGKGLWRGDVHFYYYYYFLLVLVFLAFYNWISEGIS